MRRRLFRPLSSVTALLTAALLVTASRAQAPLHLDVRGGSLPGTLELDLGDALFPFEPCLLLLGLDPGPTPIALIDPADPRSVQVGAQTAVSFFGAFALDGRFRVGPSPVPGDPALVDLGVFAQGVTFGGAGTLVDRVSNPAAIRMGLAGAFRDRGVVTSFERSFGTMIPRRDGRWMIVGGGRGDVFSQVATDTTEIYDDVTDAFVSGPTMATERSLHTQTLLADGRWLLAGGVNGNNDPQDVCEIYDPATDTFTVVAPMNSPRAGHTASLLPDGRVFVAGGLDAITVGPLGYEAIFDIVPSTEVYDPVADSWTTTASMSTPRAGHAAVVRPNGTVLLAGGISWDTIFIVQLPAIRSNCDVYDPIGNAMAAGPSMAAPRALASVVALGNDRWLVAGGSSSTSLSTFGAPTAAAQVYDAAANSWSAAGSMATPRANQLMVPLGGGQFLAVGGADGSLLAPAPLASGEVFDSASNTWSPGVGLTIPRAAAAALVTPRGQWHVIGGVTDQPGLGRFVSRTCEWYYF